MKLLFNHAIDPFDDELPREEDNAEQKKNRHKAHLLLSEVLRKVQKKYPLQAPFRLCIEDREADEWTEVSIEDIDVAWKEDCEDGSSLSCIQKIYVIRCTFEWLQEAKPREIQAIFAHEIGHAVLGHLSHEIEYYFEESWLPVIIGMQCLILIGILMQWTMLYQTFASIFCAIWLIRLGPYLKNTALSRSDEYEADAFAAEFCKAKFIIQDLKRDIGCSWWYHLKEGVSFWWSTHPSLKQRAKRLNVNI